MKKLFTFIAVICLALNASAQYQVANSDFEEWETSTSETAEPCHWNSFKTASGTLSFMSAKQMDKVTGNDAHAGTSVKINARSVAGVVAQGNMTTGQINMGGMTAGDGSANYNYTNTGNSNFNQPFTGLPDAMEVYVNASVKYSAKATALLHGNGNYYDPGDKNSGNVALIASATDLNITTTNGWVKKTILCTYNVTNGTRPAYALITFSTSATPGEGDKNDWMCVDDIKFLYYSELASATYDGNAISFNGTSATVNEYYDASKLNITSNGHGAKVETSMDESKQLLTVTIKGDNISEDATNYHTYTIQFKQYGYDLLSLAYNGVAITGYEQDGDALDVVLDEDFDINRLAYTLSEYAEPTFDYDEETGFLAITVTSKNGNSAEYDFYIYRRGDINNDSQVSIADVTSLVNIILGKQPDYKMLVVDVNGDKGVSIADVTALVNIILGKTN